MPLLEAIQQFFSERRIQASRLLVAASGGPDSTALLLALHSWPDAPFAVLIAHVNHHLRGRDSEADEAWVRTFAAERKLPFILLDGTPDAGLMREQGIEAAARESRYRCLRAAREEQGCDWIVTGHQQNDQAETLLVRLVTGVGPGRLAGIPPLTHDRIIRPLLSVPRMEIDRYLADRGVKPRHDRMNEDARFTRSRIRQELIPMLEQFNPRIVTALADTATLAREQQEGVRALLAETASRWTESLPASAKFPVESLPASLWLRKALLHREVVRLDPRGAREVSAADLDRLAKGMTRARRVSVTRALELVREGGALVLRGARPPQEPFEIRIRPEGSRRLPTGAMIRLERKGIADPEFRSDDRRRQLFQIPEGESGREFVIRNRRRGDRFQPLGSSFEKKLNELLIDRKIPKESRDRIPLLLWNGEIVWIAGVEIGERFKVTEPWRETFEVSLTEDDA